MRARRRRLFLVRFYIVLFLFISLVITLAILSGHEKVRIQTITISGNASVSTEEILTIVNRDLTGRYFYLFAKNNSLIFPRYRIRNDLLAEIKTIKDLDISWNNWQKITINIIERKPHSVWCGEDIKAISQECFLVDKEGYIYSLAPVFSGSLFIKEYGDISTSTSPISQTFLSKNTYTQIFSLIDQLADKNLKVTKFYFDNFDYHFILENGPEIIFNTKTDFDSVFDNLFVALETKNLDLEKEVSIINYIDLRFDNKIVVGKK